MPLAVLAIAPLVAPPALADPAASTPAPVGFAGYTMGGGLVTEGSGWLIHLGDAIPVGIGHAGPVDLSLLYAADAALGFAAVPRSTAAGAWDVALRIGVDATLDGFHLAAAWAPGYVHVDRKGGYTGLGASAIAAWLAPSGSGVGVAFDYERGPAPLASVSVFYVWGGAHLVGEYSDSWDGD